MGDMLFLWPGTSNLLRGQGTYLSDAEIDLITDTVSTGEQNFVHELVNIKVKSEDDENEVDEPKQLENRDELYEQAITIVVNEQRGSCSLLQRAMGIGYGRAARLIDFMAEDGYVGPYNGSKAREVMLTPEQWDNIQAGDPNPVNDEDWPDEQETAADEVAAEDKVTLKPRKLERIEPGQSVHLSANVSFAPKKRKATKQDKPVEENEDEVEFDPVDEDDEDVKAHAEVGDVDFDDVDADFEDEDLDDQYEDVDDDEDYEVEEEEECDDDEYEADQYEDLDEYEDLED
jgi:S-DNA-T family DNA segregation ATPase FtsK/SpoIIIE